MKHKQSTPHDEFNMPFNTNQTISHTYVLIRKEKQSTDSVLKNKQQLKITSDSDD
jgi:hypothetical protein